METVKTRVLLFGIARDIVGDRYLDLDLNASSNVGDLLTHVRKKYPGFRELSSLLVAVDNEYATEDVPLEGAKEVALIPPVSGG